VLLCSLGQWTQAQSTPLPEAVPMDRSSLVTQGGLVATAFGLEKIYQSVFKIEAATLNPDYSRPWSPGQFGGGRGSGFLIGKNRILTNAHVVSNTARLYVSKLGDAKKYAARVKFIAHDADLALLELEDFSAFEKLDYLKFNGVPRLEDEVRVIGYPVGGDRLSVTRGVVSRIDFANYSHSGIDEHLVIQIDAAINPGNSGGPVLLRDQVVGVAFQGLREADNTGYMIPVPVIEHFLKDIEDGTYDGYVDLGIIEFELANPVMRAGLGLANDGRGVLVGDVIKGSSACGSIKAGDVLMSIDDNPVDSSAMVSIDNQKVNMNEVVERKQAGESVKLGFLREGKMQYVSVKLATLPPKQLFRNEYEKRPCYVVNAGILLQPLTRNMMATYNFNSPYLMQRTQDFVQKGGWQSNSDIVVVGRVLDDAINSELPELRGTVLTKVNNQPVKGLQHAKQLMDSAEGEFLQLEFAPNVRPVVLKRSQLAEANKRINAKYGIQKSQNLQP